MCAHSWKSGCLLKNTQALPACLQMIESLGRGRQQPAALKHSASSGKMETDLVQRFFFFFFTNDHISNRIPKPPVNSPGLIEKQDQECQQEKEERVQKEKKNTSKKKMICSEDYYWVAVNDIGCCVAVALFIEKPDIKWVQMFVERLFYIIIQAESEL